MHCNKIKKTIESLWYSYLLFRCCIVVIPTYLMLICLWCFSSYHNIDIPIFIKTIYEFAVLIFSAAVIFIFVLVLATFNGSSGRLSVTDYDYDSDIINDIEENHNIQQNEEVLITTLEEAADQIDLLFNNSNEFVVHLVPIDDIKYDDLPPSYEEAIKNSRNN